jgi:hypothetical protein
MRAIPIQNLRGAGVRLIKLLKWEPPYLKRSECENVAKTSKIARSSTRDFITEVKPLLV